MKLLFDQNLSPRLVGILAAEFPGSARVRDLNLQASPDQDIWSHAISGNYVIVSKDSDFEQRAILYGLPPKVIWLRIGNGPVSAIVALLRGRQADILAFGADPITSLLALA